MDVFPKHANKEERGVMAFLAFLAAAVLSAEVVFVLFFETDALTALHFFIASIAVLFAVLTAMLAIVVRILLRRGR